MSNEKSEVCLMGRKKVGQFGKTTRSVCLDKVVIQKLEERSKQSGCSISSIVNFIVRHKVLIDNEYYRELAKYHYLKFQEYRYMQESMSIVQEVEG